MVQAAGGSREVIQNELLNIANEHIANWEQYAGREFRNNDFGFEFVSRQTDF